MTILQSPKKAFSLYITPILALNRNIHLFLLTAVLIGFVFDGGIYSVLFNLYLLRLDHSAAFIGQVNSAGLITFALTSLPAGFAGKRWGARPVMVLGLWLVLLGCFLIPVVEFVPVSWQAIWVIMGYVLLLFGLAFYFVNALPLVMDLTQVTERDQVLSLQTAGLALSAFLGSLVGGILPDFFVTMLESALTEPDPYRYPLLLGAIFLIPGVWAMRKIRVESANFSEVVAEIDDVADAVTAESQPDPDSGALNWGLTFMLVLVRFLQVAGMAAAMIFFNVYLDTQLLVPTVYIGLLISLGRLVSVPAALLMPRWTTKKGSVFVITVASFGVSLGMLPLALLPHWLAAGIGFIAAIAFSSMRFPAYLSYSMKLVPPRQRAVVAGAGEMAAGLSFATMSFSGGYIVEAIGYREFFLLAFVLAFMGGAIFWAYFRVPRGELVAGRG